jgi:hypothetical protein
VCFAGEAPRAVVRAPLGDGRSRAALSARDLRPSDDLRTLHAVDARLVLEGEGARATLGADEATVRGLAPLGQASNLSAPARAALLSLSALALSAGAALMILVARIASRPKAIAVGVAGSVAALLVFSSLERAPVAAVGYALVPIVGLVAMAIGAFLAGDRRDPLTRAR